MSRTYSDLKESKSIQTFKHSLVKEIPFSPNTRATKDELLNKPLRVLLLDYFTWVIRTISKRPRAVHISSEVLRDSRFHDLKDRIEKIISKAEKGEGLNPYLSNLVRSKGYIAGEDGRSQDEDLILNQKGLHHLHLGESDENGSSQRTNEVIMIRADSKDFYILGIFDHGLFDSDGIVNTRNFNTFQTANATRQHSDDDKSRLYNIYKGLTEKDMPPNTVYMANPVTSSGHPLFIVDMASKYYETIYCLDPIINTNEWQNKIYNEHGLTKPNNNKLRWVFNHSDLGLIDKCPSSWLNIFRLLCPIKCQYLGDVCGTLFLHKCYKIKECFAGLS